MSSSPCYRAFFADARNIQISVGRIEYPDQIPTAVGSRVNVPVDYAIRYSTRGREQRQETRWIVTLERTSTGWRIVGVR
jgi:hypothetical protein